MSRVTEGLQAGLAAFVDWAAKEYSLHKQAFGVGGHQHHGGSAWAPLKGRIIRGSNGKPILIRVGLDKKGNISASAARRKLANAQGLKGKTGHVMRTRGLTTPLVHTGRLRDGLKIQLTGMTMKLFDDVSYAPYHQFGTRKMVARLIIDITEQDINRLKEELKKKIEAAINKRL